MVWFYDCKKEKEKKINVLLCCGACFVHHSSLWMLKSLFCCTIELFPSRVNSLVVIPLSPTCFGSWLVPGGLRDPVMDFLVTFQSWFSHWKLVQMMMVQLSLTWCFGQATMHVSVAAFCGYAAVSWKIVCYFVSYFFGSQTLMSLKDRSVKWYVAWLWM
jgi:hypothetical protein